MYVSFFRELVKNLENHSKVVELMLNEGIKESTFSVPGRAQALDLHSHSSTC